jgi:2-polyprenyl-3-methyl-5-hydroxy-6-metoxy-1,4-benzoquinol methylase
MADYYPVEEGAEFSTERLQYWVDRGYSIAVFPEGTRSYTDQIGRFKKGAFYLAEKLQLDIEPVIFHGIANTMSKGDFLLKNGEINVKFLPRIPIDDSGFGTTYVERAKLIGRYFRAEHEAYRLEREVPRYFYERLMHTYKYKGPVLEWYAKIKIRLEHYYAPIEQWVPKEGDILNLGCGYGFLDYMLQFTSKQRRITGVDYDEEKIAIAQNGYTREDRLQFIQGDITEFVFVQKYHAILLMDVLHYLTKEKQQEVLSHCAKALHPNGVLIVRDGMSDLKGKHRGTVLTELFSTKLFQFNKTKNALDFPSTHDMKVFAAKHALHYEVVNATQYTSNLIYVFTNPS